MSIYITETFGHIAGWHTVNKLHSDLKNKNKIKFFRKEWWQCCVRGGASVVTSELLCEGC